MSDITRRISVNTSDNSGDDSTPLTPANSADNLPSNNETANEDPPRPERRMNRCWKYTGYAALAICAIWYVKYFFDGVPQWRIEDIVKKYGKE
uniref:Transmembrane protein n=1 Tax=Panagrellus redivivus TaxID=6233 RepID=A0A7E4V943_PANRE